MKKAFWILLDFLAAGLVVPVSEVLKAQTKWHSLTLFEELVLAICLLFLLLLSKSLYYSYAGYKKTLRHIETWKVVDEFDTMLEPIRVDYRSLLVQRRHEDDIMYEELIKTELAQLQREVGQAASKGEYPVKNHNFESHLFLSKLFMHSSRKIYREVYILNPEFGSFDQYYSDFFRMIVELTKKRIISVQTLFVRDDEEFRNSEEIQRLFGFYYHNKRFQMREVDMETLKPLKKEYASADDWIDFGLYGDQMLFKTKQYTKDGITDGVFSKNSTEIANCNKLLDNAWKHGAKIIPNDPKTRIALNELFQNYGT